MSSPPRAPLLLLTLLLGLTATVYAAPADQHQGPGGSSPALLAPPAGVSWSPALRVRVSDPPGAYQCTDGACSQLCRALGWGGGYCLDADWCLCWQ